MKFGLCNRVNFDITFPCSDLVIYLSVEAGHIHDCDRITTACPDRVIQHQQCSNWFRAQAYTFERIRVPKVICELKKKTKTLLKNRTHISMDGLKSVVKIRTRDYTKYSTLPSEHTVTLWNKLISILPTSTMASLLGVHFLKRSEYC